MNSSRLHFLIVLVFITSCVQKQNKKKESADRVKYADEVKSGSINNEITWQTYITEDSDFSLKFPGKWKSEVFKVGNNQRIINIYPDHAGDSLDLPLTIHENAGISFISIFPDGYGTEFPSGKRSNIEKNEEVPVMFDINMKESQAFMLENNQIWGYLIVPSSSPPNWNKNGFIFAQAAVSDFVIKCIDKESGRELKMSECDPLLGDSVKRYGKVNQEDWHVIKSILETINFEDNKNNKQPQSGDNTNEIIIAQPRPGSVISSPLEIAGKARGNWFFEAQIGIELIKDGNILASTIGKANDNWMTNDYVDFSATLEFPEVKDSGKAELLFKNSNPSGKKELEKSFSVPLVIRE